MTCEMMALRGLMEKSDGAVLLREMIGFAAERLMELEVGGLPPYHPGMMLALLLYGYSRGLYSSRQLGRAGAGRGSRCLAGSRGLGRRG